MPDRSLIFPSDEFRGRIAQFQARMAAARLDALLLTSPADIFYATGFLTRFWESPARPWFLIVPAKGEPVAVIPSIGADLMSRTWIDDIRTWDAPNPNDDGVTLLADTLRELCPNGGRIGLPMGLETHLRMPLADYERVGEAIGDRTFADATDCVQRVREIKSEAEIEKIRTTCTIAGRAFDRVPEFAGTGQTLDAAFRAFQMVCLAEGADWVSYVAGAAGPDGYGDVISPADTRPMQDGDILMLDTGAVKDGYFCDFDRNYAIGTASDAARKCYDALWQATEDVLRDLRPGHHTSDIHKILCDGLQRRGSEPGGGRLGHGLGVTLTEWPSATPLDETELRAGMVLTLEPGAIVGPGRMMVHEENIVLREDGPELLSPRAAPELPIL